MTRFTLVIPALAGLYLAMGCSGPAPVTDKISTADFEAQVLNSATPVLVDFQAEWCGPCKRVAPILHRLEEEYAGQFDLYPVDVDENPNLATKFNVYAIPEIILFVNGEVVSTYSGDLSEGDLRQWLASNANLAATTETVEGSTTEEQPAGDQPDAEAAESDPAEEPAST